MQNLLRKGNFVSKWCSTEPSESNPHWIRHGKKKTILFHQQCIKGWYPRTIKSEVIQTDSYTACSWTSAYTALKLGKFPEKKKKHIDHSPARPGACGDQCVWKWLVIDLVFRLSRFEKREYSTARTINQSSKCINLCTSQFSRDRFFTNHDIFKYRYK